MQFKPRFVQLHRDAAPAALRDVEEDDSACDGLFDDADEPFEVGALPAPKVSSTTALSPGAESMARRMFSPSPGKSLTTSIPSASRVAMRSWGEISVGCRMAGRL